MFYFVIGLVLAIVTCSFTDDVSLWTIAATGTVSALLMIISIPYIAEK